MRTAKFLRLTVHGLWQKHMTFIKWKYMAFLCPYVWDYNVWLARCNAIRERSALCVLSYLLPHDKHLRNSHIYNKLIGFDNSPCTWKLVVYRGAISSTLPQSYSWSQSMSPIPDGVPATIGSMCKTNPNHFIIFLFRRVRSSIHWTDPA